MRKRALQTGVGTRPERRRGVGLIALLWAFNAAAVAADLNLSGTWVLDKDRSFSNPPGLDQKLTIRHKGDVVELEARLTTAQQGEQIVQEHWTLDSQVREFDPPAAGPKGKRKAYWLPGKRGVVVEEETSTETPQGTVPRKTTRKFTLSPDGGTLTVDYYNDTPRGTFEAKRVFLKK